MKQIFVVSDGSGETALSLLKASLAKIHIPHLQIYRFKNLRTEEQLSTLISEVKEKNALVVFTLAKTELRQWMSQECQKRSIPHIDLLGPVVLQLSQFLEQTIELSPGALRVVDRSYYDRMEAIEYTVKHDDGRNLDDLDQADIVLLGISRTSKTPLSIFLSYQGFKVANVPIVLGQPLPPEVFRMDQRKIFALTINEEALHRIRQNRVNRIQGEKDMGIRYAGLDHILEELQYAEGLFHSNRKWPIINVTDRALEETASEIIRIYNSRMGRSDQVTW